MTEEKFTGTRGNQGATAGVNRGHTFTHDDPTSSSRWT
jgi:hypothetical protein